MSEEKGIYVEMGNKENATVTILQGTAPKPVEVYIKDSDHTKCSNVQSFVAFLKKYGTPENSVVSYKGEYIHAIVDNTIVDRDYDELSCSLKQHYAFKALQRTFCDGSRKEFGQKTFKEFLKKFSSYAPIAETLIPKLDTLVFTKQTLIEEHNSEETKGKSYIVKTEKSSLQLPKEIVFKLPVFNASQEFFVSANMELVLPQNESEQIKFVLSFPFGFDEVIENAKEYEYNKLKNLLNGTPMPGEKIELSEEKCCDAPEPKQWLVLYAE